MPTRCSMKQCPGCDRFVQPDEDACPFCDFRWVDPEACDGLTLQATSTWVQAGVAALSFAGVTAIAACAYGTADPYIDCDPGETYDPPSGMCKPVGDVEEDADTTDEPDTSVGDTEAGDATDTDEIPDASDADDGDADDADTVSDAEGDTAGPADTDSADTAVADTAPADTVAADTAGGTDATDSGTDAQ